MNFRTANPSEFKIIADFQIRMASETEDLLLDIDIVSKGVQAVFNDPSKGQYYVVEDKDKDKDKDKANIIASLMTTYEWSDWRNSQVIWIQSVYVTPEYRKKGVFKLMYKEIKNIVNNDRKYSGIRLYVDLTNENARKVYKAIGMEGNHYQLFEDMK